MKTQILIIGGGFAGVTVAQKLEKQGINTLLVDKKDYFEVTYAVLRDVAAPQHTNGKSRKLYKNILNGSFIQGSVIELFANKARLANGENIEFETVVLASGSRYPTLPLAKSDNALSLNQRNVEISNYNRSLTTADNVLIIGGGVVGVELAGEIAFAMPNASVTLAHNTNNLLNGFSSKAQVKAYNQLKDLGVNIKLNSNYQKHEKSYKNVKSGHLLTPDIVFETTGTAPNNEYLKPHLSHLLNEKGLVNVDNKLRVIGQDNFFAIGDIADVKEAKLGYLAVEQGKYLAKAIANEIQNKPTKAYKTNPFMALVPTGQKTGIVQLPFATTSWRALVNMKQKDLFISKTYKGFE